MFFQRYVVILIVLIISGCQSLPDPVEADPKAIWLNDPNQFEQRASRAKQQTKWRYSAKVGISAPSVTEQANLVWEYDDQANNMRLFGPLGIGAIKLQFDEYGVVLSDNKGVVHRGDSAEQLLTRIVGWPIPIDALRSWIFVLPQDGAVYRYQLDENQQVKTLEQLGWRIEYSSYRDFGGRLMPRKIVATRVVSPYAGNASESDVVVKLITKSWK